MTSEIERSVFLGPPHLSVVIVSWNTCEMLTACIDSILKFTPRETPVEIIVVDNASSDQTASAVRSKYPNILFIQNTDNIGFAAANNLGIKHARGRYVLLLNPDTLFFEDSLTTLLSKIEADASIGLIACKLLNKDHTVQWSADLFPVPFHEINPLFMLKRRRLLNSVAESIERNVPIDVGCVIGAFQLIKRDNLARLGLLDSSLFMYGEDLDLCYKFSRAKKRIVYDPTVAIVHLGGQSSAQVWTETTRLTRVRDSIFRIHCKHFGVAAAVFSLMLRVILSWLRCLVLVPRSWVRPDSKQYLLDFRANWAAFTHIPRILLSMKAVRS